jgi:RHS repeat-associated protein
VGAQFLVRVHLSEDSAGPHAVTSLSDGSAFAYDANGNMIQRVQDGVTWTYTFDAENRLVGVSDGSTVTTMVYDGNGARIERVVDDGETVTTTLYVAGMEIESVGGVESQRTVYYGAGGAFRIIGGDNAGLYFRHSDHLGSTSVLSDANGLRVEGSDVVYAPFGEIRIGEQSELTDFGYTGQRLDESTGGLMYYGARYYLPELRRFISADTIVPSIVNPQALNRYSYVLNNPINLIDPTGHWTDRYTDRFARHNIDDSNDIRTFLEIHDLREELRANDVTVEFEACAVGGDNYRSPRERRDALRTIRDTVQTFEAEFQERASLTFTDVMPATHVLVRNGNALSPGRLGLNDYWYDSEGNIIGREITFAMGGLLGTASGYTETSQGINIAAHEFAHNLTWGVSIEWDYVTWATESIARADREFFGVTAGRYAYITDAVISSAPGLGYDWHGELTADAISSLILGAFDQDDLGEVSGRVSDFMDDRLRAHADSLSVDQGE